MKTANKCPKCGARDEIQNVYNLWDCGSEARVDGTDWVQSDLCRERVKVAKLKKQNDKLKERTKALQEWGETAEEAIRSLQKIIDTLRNPKF